MITIPQESPKAHNYEKPTNRQIIKENIVYFDNQLCCLEPKWLNVLDRKFTPNKSKGSEKRFPWRRNKKEK